MSLVISKDDFARGSIKLQDKPSPCLQAFTFSSIANDVQRFSRGGHHELLSCSGPTFEPMFKTGVSDAAEFFMGFIRFLSDCAMLDNTTGSQSLHSVSINLHLDGRLSVSSWPMWFAISTMLVAICSMAVVVAQSTQRSRRDRRGTRRELSCEQSERPRWQPELRHHLPCPGNKFFLVQARLVCNTLPLESHPVHHDVLDWSRRSVPLHRGRPLHTYQRRVSHHCA